MRQDTEVGTVVAAKDVKKEGPCSDRDTAAGGEPGAGKIGGGESGRFGKPVDYR